VPKHLSLQQHSRFCAFIAQNVRLKFPNRSYPQIGVPDAHHEISHHHNVSEAIKKNVKIQGGAWIGFPGVARASYRYWFIPNLRVANIGFRCVLSK